MKALSRGRTRFFGPRDQIREHYRSPVAESLLLQIRNLDNLTNQETQTRQAIENVMIQINDIVQLQTDTVERWHREPVDNPYTEFLQSVCTQHQFNYLLWHEEDIARSPDVSDTEIASVKRKIDKYNQRRNDWIERVDDCITELVQANEVAVPDDAKLNTETPGSVIDRLSIMALRIYHLDEQLQRDDVEDSHRESVQHKIAICRLQQSELGNSLQELLSEIFAGRKRHRTYRQFKMYNDPSLNPYLYNAQKG